MHTLLHGGLALSSLDEALLLPGTKGLPLTEPLRQGAIGVQGWNVLRGDTSFPVAILKDAHLRHNLAWMHAFCARHGVTLAPHGKTTMSPQLFGAQLAGGAWGITLATARQVQVAHRFGVRRVLLANELIARADIAAVLALLHGDPDFDCIVLADSVDGVARLARAAAQYRLARPLPVLVELGLAGKRAGCRSPQQALALARTVAATDGLALAGFEGYEGLLVSDDHDGDLRQVETFLSELVALVRGADAEGLFAGSEIVLSAGGSSYFDLVAQGFGGIDGLSRPLRAVLRSGCYLTSDHGLYARHIEQLAMREGGQDSSQDSQEGLLAALEIWSVVQSRPEPALAILSMGKRDASHDAGLPVPLYTARPAPDQPGGPVQPAALPPGCAIVKMNDQHAYLRLPDGDPLCQTLAVGDLVGCGISHPCTTFDKWTLLLAVDDGYTVRYAVNTFF